MSSRKLNGGHTERTDHGVRGTPAGPFPRWRTLLQRTSYATAASQLGYTVLCANDHLVYSRPHLDSLTALAIVIESSGQMKLMTSIALLVIRGATPLAKAWPRSTCFPAGE